jgi:hypothetical protein
MPKIYSRAEIVNGTGWPRNARFALVEAEPAERVHKHDGVRIIGDVRQTSCRYCGHDIEGMAPYKRGQWFDRGNNTTCGETGAKHAPVSD